MHVISHVLSGRVILRQIRCLRDSVTTSIRRKILAISVLLALVSSGWADEAAAQSTFDLSATDVAILAPDSELVIGHGHYKLSHVDGFDVAEGENKYLDGEYDR